MNERRMSRRLSVNFPAALTAGPFTAGGAIRQISGSGMIFECLRHFDSKENILFDLQVFGKEPPITVEGKVIYKTYHNEGNDGQDTTLRYAVQFTSLDNYLHKNSIEKIIAHLITHEHTAAES